MWNKQKILHEDNTVKPVLSGHSKRRPKIGFHDRRMLKECRSKVFQNALFEHSAILLTFIKLPFVFKTFVLSIFEWQLKTGITVCICYLNKK